MLEGKGSKVSPMKNDRRASNILFDPNDLAIVYTTKLRVFWDTLMFLVMTLQAFFIPIQVSVFANVATESTPFQTEKLIDIILTGICVVDLVLRRKREFYDPLRTSAFVGDCITTLPIWLLVALISPEHSHKYVSVQMVRLIRLRRVEDYLVGTSVVASSAFYFIVDSLGLRSFIRSLTELRPARRVIGVFFMLLLLGNIPACIYFILGNDVVQDDLASNYSTTKGSWLYQEDLAGATSLRAQEDPLGVEMLRFTRSLYFSIQTFFTVGFGDNAPQSGPSMAFTIFLSLSGVVFLAIVIANIESAFMNLDSTSKFYEQDYELVEKVLRATRAPNELQSKVRTYFLNLWNECKGLHEKRVLSNFPHALSYRVEALLYSNLKIPLFEETSAAFLRRLLDTCQVVVYGKGDLIIERGKKADRTLFIIKTGKAYLSDKKANEGAHRNLRTVNREQCYGMHAFLLDDEYRYSMVVPVYGFAEIITLTFRKFKSAVENEHKQDLRHLLSYDKDKEENHELIMRSLKQEREVFNKIEAYLQNMKKSRKVSDRTGGDQSSGQTEDEEEKWKMDPVSTKRLLLDVMVAVCVLWFALSTPAAIGFSLINESSLLQNTWVMTVDLVLGFFLILDADVLQQYFVKESKTKISMKTKREMTLAQRRSSVGINSTATRETGRRTMMEEMQLAVREAERKKREERNRKIFSLVRLLYFLVLVLSGPPLYLFGSASEASRVEVDLQHFGQDVNASFAKSVKIYDEGGENMALGCFTPQNVSNATQVTENACNVDIGEGRVQFDFVNPVEISFVKIVATPGVSLYQAGVKVENKSSGSNCCNRKQWSCSSEGGGTSLTFVRNTWNRIWVMLRFPLLAYSFQFFALIKKLQMHASNRNVVLSHTSMMAFKLFVVYIITAHWTACFSAVVVFDYCGVQIGELADLYVRSFYWTLTAMSTVGFGDISPNELNSMQTIYATLVMLLGVTLYSGVISFITNLLKDAVEASDHNPDHMRGVLQKYMLVRALDVDTQGRVLEYLDFVHSVQRRGTASRIDIMLTLGLSQDPTTYARTSEYLPSGLRDEIVLTMTENMITNSNLFKDFRNEKTFLLGVSQKLRYQIFCPWDMVIDKTAMRREMCFLMSGAAEVISRGSSTSNTNIVVLQNLDEGNCFGEEIMFGKVGSPSKDGDSSASSSKNKGKEDDSVAEVRSKTMSELWFLGWKGFLSLQNEYPTQFEQAYNTGLEKFQGGKTVGNQMAKNLKNRKLAKLMMQDNEIAVTKKRKIFALDDVFPRHWHRVTFLALLWNLIMIPLRIAFVGDRPWNSLLIVDYVFDITLIIDVFLRFRHFAIEVHMSDGVQVVDEPKDIPKAYLKSWAMIDIVATLPVDIIYAVIMLASGKEILLMQVALCRLVKLARVSRMGQHLGALGYTLRNGVLKNLVKVGKLVIMFLLVAHWAGCFFFKIAKTYGDSEGTSWVMLASRLNANSRNATQTTSEYVHSFYWAVNLVTSVGYGDIVPTMMPEYYFNIFIMMIGGILYSVIVANLEDIVANTDPTSKLFQDRNDQLNELMQWRKLPNRLRSRITVYMADIWTQQKGADEDTILKMLNPSLRARVIQQQIGPAVEKTPVFGADAANIGYSILPLFTGMMVPRMGLVYEHGELGDALYYIFTGKVELVSENWKTIFRNCEAGMYFGDEAFFRKKPYECGARAAVVTQLLYIEWSSLDRLLASDPDLEAKFQKHVRGSIRKRRTSIMDTQKNLKNKKMAKMFEQSEQLNQIKKRDYVILPTSTGRRYWEIFILFIYFYNAATIPLKLGFLQENTPANESIYNALLIADIALDLCLIVHTVLRARFFADVYNGVFVKVPKDITRSFFWYPAILCIVMLIPSDYVALAVSGNFMGAVFRIPRLLGMAFVNKHLRAIQDALESKMIYIQSGVRLFVKLILGILFLAHWISCGRSFIFWAQGVRCDEFTDLYYEECSRDSVPGNSTADVTFQYIRSSYFTMYTLTTVGYGNVSVRSDIDMLYAVFVMLVGALLCDAGITAIIISIIEDRDFKEARDRREDDCVERYMVTKHLDDDLRNSILEFYDYKAYHMQEHPNLDIKEAWTTLPSIFVAEMKGYIALKHVRDIIQIPSLRSYSAGMLRAMARRLKSRIFIPDELIFVAGSRMNRLVFLLNGEVEEQETPEDGGPRVVCRRIHPSDEGLLCGKENFEAILKFTYQASVFCDTYILNSREYHEVNSCAPKIGGLYRDFEEMLNDKIGCDFFRRFVESQYSSENLKFYLAVEEYQGLQEGSATMKERAKTLFDRFISHDSPEQINIDNKCFIDIKNSYLYAGSSLFCEAQNVILRNMEKDSLVRFLRSPLYDEMAKVVAKSRQGKGKDALSLQKFERSPADSPSKRRFSNIQHMLNRVSLAHLFKGNAGGKSPRKSPRS